MQRKERKRNAILLILVSVKRVQSVIWIMCWWSVQVRNRKVTKKCCHSTQTMLFLHDKRNRNFPLKEASKTHGNSLLACFRCCQHFWHMYTHVVVNARCWYWWKQTTDRQCVFLSVYLFTWLFYWHVGMRVINKWWGEDFWPSSGHLIVSAKLQAPFYYFSI